MTESVVEPRCYRHSDRETYIRCGRCERPICPDCMQPAPVGFHCPECVAAGRRSVREARTLAGGRLQVGQVVTMTLIAVNVVMFVAQQALPGLQLDLALVGGALVPGGGAIGVATGQWYRLLTAAFLHASIPHLAFNMVALYLVGPSLERHLGRTRYLVLYVVAALGGSVASYLISSPAQVGLGASGAVFGLFGAALVLARRLQADARSLFTIIGLNLVLGFVIPNVDWRAHLGGLVTGTAVAALLLYVPRPLQSVVQPVGIALVVLVLVALAVLRTASLTG